MIQIMTLLLLGIVIVGGESDIDAGSVKLYGRQYEKDDVAHYDDRHRTVHVGHQRPGFIYELMSTLSNQINRSEGQQKRPMSSVIVGGTHLRTSIWDCRNWV